MMTKPVIAASKLLGFRLLEIDGTLTADDGSVVALGAKLGEKTGDKNGDGGDGDKNGEGGDRGGDPVFVKAVVA